MEEVVKAVEARVVARVVGTVVALEAWKAAGMVGEEMAEV